MCPSLIAHKRWRSGKCRSTSQPSGLQTPTRLPSLPLLLTAHRSESRHQRCPLAHPVGQQTRNSQPSCRQGWLVGERQGWVVGAEHVQTTYRLDACRGALDERYEPLLLRPSHSFARTILLSLPLSPLQMEGQMPPPPTTPVPRTIPPCQSPGPQTVPLVGTARLKPSFSSVCLLAQLCPVSRTGQRERG